MAASRTTGKMIEREEKHTSVYNKPVGIRGLKTKITERTPGKMTEGKEGTPGQMEDVVVGWLLHVPATCECISGTDLHRQFYVLPH